MLPVAAVEVGTFLDARGACGRLQLGLSTAVSGARIYAAPKRLLGELIGLWYCCYSVARYTALSLLQLCLRGWVFRGCPAFSPTLLPHFVLPCLFLVIYNIRGIQPLFTAIL